MRRPTTTTTIITGALALAFTAAVPVEARAADPAAMQLLGTRVTPAVVAIGTTKMKTVHVEARTTPPDGSARVLATVGGLPTGFAVSLTATETGTDAWVWQGDLRVPPAELDNALAGAVETTFTSYGRFDDDPLGEVVDTEVNHDLALVRAARVSVNATPERPRRGQTITITGTLARADWDEGVYRGYPNRPVDLHFRPKGGADALVARVSSGPSGALRTTVRARGEGAWSWRYRGNVTTGADASPRDAIDVR